MNQQIEDPNKDIPTEELGSLEEVEVNYVWVKKKKFDWIIWDLKLLRKFFNFWFSYQKYLIFQTQIPKVSR